MHRNGQEESLKKRKTRRISFSVFPKIISKSRNRRFCCPDVIKLSKKGQMITVQSQENCPLHFKQPLNLYWFRLMQRFQTSVHCPPNCSLFFILPLASQAAFIKASPTYASLLVYLNAISKRPPLHFPSTLLPFHFVCGHHHFLPISCVPGLPGYQVCRNESWGSRGALCHWSATCYALNTNRSSLKLVCRTPIAPLAPAVAAHLKFDKALWGQRIPSEVTPFSH